MPSNGTIIIYKAVIKPAFPTFVSVEYKEIPICCKLLPAQRAIPHKIPPAHNSFFFSIFFLGLVSGFILCNKKIQGINTIPPNKFRTALNVNGCTYSIPTLCATKAIPQINAVINNILLRFHISFFMFNSFLLQDLSFYVMIILLYINLNSLLLLERAYYDEIAI